MPRRCTICTNADREAIDSELIQGEKYRNIAEKYSLALTSVYRHKCEHIPAALTLAREAKRVAAADDLLEQVRYLQEHALDILAAAEKDGKLVVALAAIREARGNLELLCKLAGKLQENQTVNVLITNPDWLQLRSRLLKTLESYPEARLAVVGALAVCIQTNESS